MPNTAHTTQPAEKHNNNTDTRGEKADLHFIASTRFFTTLENFKKKKKLIAFPAFPLQHQAIAHMI